MNKKTILSLIIGFIIGATTSTGINYISERKPSTLTHEEAITLINTTKRVNMIQCDINCNNTCLRANDRYTDKIETCSAIQYTQMVNRAKFQQERYTTKGE